MSTTSGTMKSFRVTDPQGNVYVMTPVDNTARTAAANALSTATSLNVDSVKYKTVKIGSQIWMAENLDWKFSGCVIGASGHSFSEARGNYYIMAINSSNKIDNYSYTNKANGYSLRLVRDAT